MRKGDGMRREVGELDKAFSRYVKETHPQCERCGAPSTDCAHIITRKVWGLRWDTLNVKAMCRACHAWGHKYPAAFERWVGEERMRVLRGLAQKLVTRRDAVARAESLYG